MDKLKNIILNLIENELQSDPSEDTFEAFEENINNLNSEYGQYQILDSILEILKDYSYHKCWYLAVSIISWFVEEGDIDLPVKWQELVAILYFCLDLFPDLGVSEGADGENLVWGIAHSLKNVDYLSEWNPIKDPEIIKYIKQLKKELLDEH